jgi:hypothetical protein
MLFGNFNVLRKNPFNFCRAMDLAVSDNGVLD